MTIYHVMTDTDLSTIKTEDCAMYRLSRETCFAVQLHQHNWQRIERREQEIKFLFSGLDGGREKDQLRTGNPIQILNIARITMLSPVICQVEV